MLAIARGIVAQRTGKFDPSKFRDRYQEALRELIEAKMKGVAIKPRAFSTPAPVIDLMAALKRSLGQEAPSVRASTAKRGSKPAPIGVSERCFCQCQVAKERRKSRRHNQPQSPKGDARKPDNACQYAPQGTANLREEGWDIVRRLGLVLGTVIVLIVIVLSV
jgi:hypothetical protein